MHVDADLAAWPRWFEEWPAVRVAEEVVLYARDRRAVRVPALPGRGPKVSCRAASWHPEA